MDKQLTEEDIKRIINEAISNFYFKSNIKNGYIEVVDKTTGNKIKLNGTTNAIEFWNNDGGKTSDMVVSYNPLNGLGGMDLNAGGISMQLAGKSNEGSLIMNLPDHAYFGLDWYGGDTTTERVITNADVVIEDTNKGVVLKSANGTYYRLVVANDGTLSTEAY